MSPERVENYNEIKPETGVAEYEKYHHVELGDIDPSQGQAQDFTQSNNSNNTLPTKQVEPLEIVKGMISAGFTPTKAQLNSSLANLSGPHDSPNTWFAFFLQKLIRQLKLKKSRNN